VRTALPIIFAFFALCGCKPSWQRQAEAAASHGLNDPSSAQFRNIKLCDRGSGVEGEMNAKNLYGAYTGFRPFIHVDGAQAAVFFQGEKFDSAPYYLIAKRCWSDIRWQSEFPDGYPPGLDRKFWQRLLAAGD